MNLRLLFVSVIFSCLGAAPFVSAGLDPAKEINKYRHRVWMKKDGLPSNSVHAIVQSPDGYLWFGTDDGLARFDGQLFTIFTTRTTPALLGNQIFSLLLSSDSTLWIGTRGGGVNCLSNSTFSTFRVDGVSHIVWVSVEDDDGVIWGGNNDGDLLRLENGVFVPVFTHTKAIRGAIRDICFDRHRRLWLGGHGGVYCIADRIQRMCSATRSPRL